MLPSPPRPKWWQLYLIFPLLIALFIQEARFRISTRGHQAVQIGIILLVYGLIHLWLKANAAALSGIDQRIDHGMITVIRLPVSQLQEAEKSPLLELPALEIKGVLSDTCEIEYIDAEVFPIDEVDQN